MTIKLNKKYSISKTSKPYIIAEIGANHNGQLKLAKKLIDLAKKSGADCVKFQSWSKDSVFSKIVYEDNYFLEDDYRNRKDTNLEKIVEKFVTSKNDLISLKTYSKKIGIDFAVTPFSIPEVDFLVNVLKVEFIKIASMDLNNYSLIEYIASKKKPIILSTGMASLSEIDKAISIIESKGNKKIIVLHCVSIYPPKDKDINLKKIQTLSKIYPYPIGFSDHTKGTNISLGAVALGASMIEKHFTIDKNMDGWDHKISADENDLIKIVEGSSQIYKALGSSRIIRVEDKKRIKAFRRSIVAAKKIKKGQIIKKEMLNCKRPGNGLKPEDAKYIIGKIANRDIQFDEIIKFKDF